jgi:hypothetical protein
VSPQGHGAGKAHLDHAEWAEDAPARERRARSERRAAERRRGSGSAAAPSTERRSTPSERRRAARREDDARASRRPATRHSARNKASLMPGPGVAERRAVILVTFLLVVYGLVMAYSASSAEAYFQYDSSFYFVKRQLLWVLLGVGAMWVLSRVDYAWWRR